MTDGAASNQQTSGLRNLIAVYQVLGDTVPDPPPPQPSRLDGLGINAMNLVDWGEPVGTGPNLVTALQRIVDDTVSGSPLSTTKKARLFQGIAGIVRKQVTMPQTLSSPLPDFDAPQADDLLVNVIAAMGPDDIPFETRQSRAHAAAPELIAQMRQGAGLREQSIKFAIGNDVLPVDALYVKPCRTDRVHIEVAGVTHECVIIDTECGAPDISLEDVKAVINPYNWAMNYSEFFNEMSSAGPFQHDGWTRVVEKVSLTGVGTELVTTQLRFHTTEDAESGSAQIDYDLDCLPPADGEGDGEVLVDRGWINMWSSGRGVRVRTRKIVRVKDIPPVVQKWVGVLGYGDASAEFVLGAARTPPEGVKPFLYRGPDPSASQSAEPQEVESRPPGAHFAPTAVHLWTDMVRDQMFAYMDVADKWTRNDLTVDEFGDYLSGTANRVIRTPLEFLELMTRPRIPGGSSGQSGTQSGGAS